VYEELVASTQYERIRMPGLDPKRADIIVAGSVLVSTLVRLLKSDRIVLSDKGIREGIILDFIEKNKKRIKGEEEIPNIRERSVWQLARRYAVDEEHAKQTASLADMIFQGTRRLHRLGPDAREILNFASVLHDIGYHVSFQKHHKHSYYLIVNSDLDGFTPDEVRLIAAVARYHRKQLPKKTDTALLRLKKSSQHTARVLAAILRIADGLDRTHFSVIKSLRCRMRPKALRLIIKTRQDWEIEHWQANERADLFKQLFHRKVEIVPAKDRS
jgi:exopolyphosphatase/guanosine-5'-triphosphate,3'-diphosphate pyrophosphatase